MHIINKTKLNGLKVALNYDFKDDKLLIEALSHPSLNHNLTNSKPSFSYERLEFLGDTVLNLIISEILFKLYPAYNEGKLAKLRASLVCREQISKIARLINLAPHILMTDGEEKSGGRNNISNLENVMEAIIGAIYLDGGIIAAKQTVTILWQATLDAPAQLYNDPKSELQELVQGQKWPIPHYELVNQTGDAHNPSFQIKVSAGGAIAMAIGNSKKIAEKEAAKLLIQILANDKLQQN